MFSLMINKLLHKKWMVLCLIIGNVLLIAVASSYPLYRVSSFQKMLTDEFDEYMETEHQWPAVLQVSYNSIFGGSKIGYEVMNEEAENAIASLGVEVLEKAEIYSMSTQSTTPLVVRDGESEKRISMSAVSALEEHIEILNGRLPAQNISEDGYLEVIVRDSDMAVEDILLNDEFTCEKLCYGDGRNAKIRVVGVFRVVDENEYFWELLGDVSGQVFADIDAYKSSFIGVGVEKNYTMSASWSYMWNYENLKTNQVGSLIYSMNRLDKNTNLKGHIDYGAARDIVSGYSAKAKRIEATLLILQVPVLLLLCAFLYMISGQMLQMEQNEISLMRSRGATKFQILQLYVMQSTFLSGISLLAGVPLGVLFCKLLGSSTAFLEFSVTRSLPMFFTSDVFLYALFAVLISVVMTTIPALSYSGLSIVKLKQGRSRQKKSLWKKMYFDVICIAISMYGYYSFNKSSDKMIENILSGESLDPLLYISFSLFILGAGLFMARLQPIIMKLYFALFKNHVKPSTYASLIGTIRTGAKQEFIILFMILTVSIGISDTMIARTIVNNALNNTRHLVGADIVVKEKWLNNRASVIRDPNVKLTYTEPEYEKYNTIPGVETVTQVLVDEECKVQDKEGLNCTLLGIKASGFYKLTELDNNLLPYTYADYLNVLASDKQGILVSENFLTKQNYKLGDVISYKNADGEQAVGYINGFFPYWPTYSDVNYKLNDDGSVGTDENYMIVANLSYLQTKWGAYPYEVWMKTSDGGQGFYQWVQNENNISLVKLEDMADKEQKIIGDTMFQGTNGILSMSFIVILLLCCVGYLIYWIMSIRSRELLFGVLRAMGMRKKEINWLLVVEQICSGLYAIVAGGFVGILASNMFVPMIQKAYAASEQILPLQLITKTGDIVQLFTVIGIVLIVCLVIIGKIVSSMNISSALKLGED